jgi:hypothetical protein
MDMHGNFSREQLRLAYTEAWRKRLDGSLLTSLEAMIADVIELHPEYHAMMRDAGAAVGLEPSAAQSAENPFLHLGLHIAVREQVSVDRPPGTRELQGRLTAQCGSVHSAEHVMMEALAETLWEAQQTGQSPDEARYLERARHRLATRDRR